MRILAIRGRNLASLARAFEVDLEHGPLAGVGLFAITGPVGAGKSTLLDAMCLPLFDQTPRLRGRGGSPVGDADEDPEAWLRANDPRTLLRRDAAEGFAEVDFVGRDGVRYRAHWAVRRARRRPDGRVQEQELSLRDLDRGIVVASGRRSEVLAAIQQRLGLDFAQFCRSVLLAQGDFAAFLQAPADERAKLLETLTGAGIYRRLSRAAHERRRVEERAVDTLRAQMEGQSPLAAPERAELERMQERWSKQVAMCEIAASLASKYVTWHETAELQRAAEAAATDALHAALAANAAAEPQRIALARLQRAMAVVPRQELATQARAKWEAAGRAAAAAARVAETARAAAARAEIAWRRAFAAVFGADASPVAAPLLRDGAQWEPLLQQWQANAQRAAAIAAALPERAAAAVAADAAVASQRAAVVSAQADKDAAAAEFARTQLGIDAIDTAALATQRNALVLRRAQVRALAAAASAWVAADATLQASTSRSHELQVRLVALRSTSDAAAALQRAATATKERLAQEVDRARTHAGLAGLRSQLHEGSPCPLCGAAEHDVAALESADLDLVTRALAQAERGAAAAAQQAATALAELRAHEREQQRAAVELAAATAQVAAAQAAFAACGAVVVDSAAAAALATTAQREFDAAEQALRAVDEAANAAMAASRQAMVRLGVAEKAALAANALLEQQAELQRRAAEAVQQLQREAMQCAQRAGDAAAALAPACVGLPGGGEAIPVLLVREQAPLRSLRSALQAVTEAAAAVQTAEVAAANAALAVQQREAEAAELERAFQAALQQAEVDAADVGKAVGVTAAALREQAAALQELQASVERCRAIVGERAQQRRQHESHERPSLDAVEAGKALREARDDQAAASKELELVRRQLYVDDLVHKQRAELLPRLQQAQATLDTWVMLDDLIGSSAGDAFAVFAQGLTLDLLLGEANRRLEALVGRYRLQRNRTGELDFVVVDRDLGGSVRALQTLSGGETFLVSLALALALATLAAPRSRVETLFLDEGFGTLDAQSLEVALGALDSLQAAGCQVGIISHVDGIAERIGAQVVVQPDGAGQSRVLARVR